MTNTKLSVLCWNVAHPSKERAAKQIQWLSRRPEDVFVLTETNGRAGCDLIAQHFNGQQFFDGRQYYLYRTEPEGNEFGVMVVSRYPLSVSRFSQSITYLAPRVASVGVALPGSELEIIGVYVPSRNATQEKIDRKKRFLENLLQALRLNPVSNRIICGDLNVLEPDHNPHYGFFQAWEYDFYRGLANRQLKDTFRHLNPSAKEYSWVGKTGDGYRYDHCFVSQRLVPALRSATYIHEPRHSKLSDHSALTVGLEWGVEST